MKVWLIIFLLFPSLAFSQFNYRKISFSLAGGASAPHMDVTDFSFEPVINAGIHYNISPYAAIGLDAEIGKLEGSYLTQSHNSEGIITKEVYGFTNKFVTTALDVRLQMGQFVGRAGDDLSTILKSLYVGAGMGIVRSDAESHSNRPETTPGDPAGDGNIIYKSTDFIVPVFAGANIPLLKELDTEILTLFLNYRLNVSFSDDLDALSNPGSRSNDHFSTLSAGIRFHFGPRRPYFYNAYH